MQTEVDGLNDDDGGDPRLREGVSTPLRANGTSPNRQHGASDRDGADTSHDDGSPSLRTSRSYEAQLRRVLNGAADAPHSPRQGPHQRASAAPRASTNGVQHASKRQSVRVSLPLRDTVTTESTVAPQDVPSPSSVSSPPRTPTPPRDHSAPLSTSQASSVGLGRPPRRPALHPRISRLRSSQTQRHRRAPSDAATTITPRPDARPFSPSSSHLDALSRRSSSSNIFDGGGAFSERASSSADSQAHAAVEPSPIRWTPLKRLTARLTSAKTAHASSGQTLPRSLGKPVCIAASGVIAIGSDLGVVVVFNYNQTLRCICGTDASEAEVGGVTALSISQDHSFIAVGYETGAIRLYDLASPTQPYRTVFPPSAEQIIAGRAEGHIAGTAIRFIGFVGAHHASVVSVDDRGLAFAHALGKILGLASTDLVRILGRYPEESKARSKKRAPIWDMAALPLGTEAHAADSHALVALITPAKMVLIGLKPKPRTWWRGKPAEGKERNPACASVAWHPNVTGQASHPMLAFSWDDDIRILSIKPHPGGGPTLAIEEGPAIQACGFVVGLHWLSARTLLLVMPAQLEIYDVPTGQRTGQVPFDVSALAGIDNVRPLSPLLGGPAPISLNTSNLRVYRGKVFVLSQSQVRVGIVLSWADRILALVSADELLDAIALTTSFYLGEAHASSLGLPDDDVARHSIVSPKLNELLAACIDYVFSDERMRDGTHDGGVDRTSLFEGLVDVSVRACLALDKMSLVWDEVFERFLEQGIEGVFLDRIEPFVLAGQLRSCPTQVMQKLIARHEERDESGAVEQLIWHVDPQHLDLDQALSLCRRWRLYDAMAHIQTRALGDYVAPLVEFLRLIRIEWQTRRYQTTGSDNGYFFTEDSATDAYKAYSYLADVLTGSSFPVHEPLPTEEANLARSDLYAFIFSGRSLAWPPYGGRIVLTIDEEGPSEPTYPYLRLLLRFDAEAALDMFDAAFEDTYLDEGASVDRQLMTNVLLEVMNPSSGDFTMADRTFLNIFVARNLAKYQQSQFVLLPPSTAHRILVGLTDDVDENTIEDRQLAAEYLLSVYQPHDLLDMLERFEKAQFHRILRSIYRNERRWAALALVYLRDTEISGDIFPHLADLLARAEVDDGHDERRQAQGIILDAVAHLADLDTRATAELIDRFLPTAHDETVRRLSESRGQQYTYLRYLLDPSVRADIESSFQPARRCEITLETRHLYIDLLCEYDPTAVIGFLGSFDRVDDVSMAICEERSVFTAVIWALDHNGQPERALDRFQDVINSRSDLLRQSRLNGGPEDPDLVAQAAAVAREACALASRTWPAEAAEAVWVRVLAALVGLARAAPTVTTPLLEDALHALVGVHSGPERARISLSRLARRLLTTSTGVSGNFGALRPLIDGLLAAHRSEAATLVAARELAERDRFEALAAYVAARGRGWSPAVQPAEAVCETCGEPAWMVRPAFGAARPAPSSPLMDHNGANLDDEEHDYHVTKLALSSPERTRPSSRTAKSATSKGKEPVEPAEASRVADAALLAKRRAAWKYASGVMLRADGKMWHRACYEAVVDSDGQRTETSRELPHDDDGNDVDGDNVQ